MKTTTHPKSIIQNPSSRPPAGLGRGLTEIRAAQSSAGVPPVFLEIRVRQRSYYMPAARALTCHQVREIGPRPGISVRLGRGIWRPCIEVDLHAGRTAQLLTLLAR